MKTKNNIFSVMLSGAKYLWHGAAPAHGRRSFTMFRMTMMLAAVVALSACSEGEWMDKAADARPDNSRTVSVNINLPAGKPGYSETDTRTTTTTSWAEGDELLMQVVLQEGETRYTDYITLTYNGTAWNVPDGAMLITAPTLTLEGELEVRIPEAVTGEVTPSVQLYYAPECTVEDNELTLKADAMTTAPESWSLSDGNWIADVARLRIHTGAEGDVVKLTSAGFAGAFNNTKGIYTATTDANGNAYFYGTMAEATSGFTVSVEVGTTLDDGSTVSVDMPVLEASPLVPVTLAAGKGYMVDAEEKRDAAADALNTMLAEHPNGYNVAADGTYEVYTYKGLMAWRNSDNVLSTSVKLMANITLPTAGITVTEGQPTGSNWTPVGDSDTPYTGTFDGNGKTISGLRISSTSDYTGLVGYMNGCTVENLTLNDAVVHSTADDTGGTAYSTGGIVGYNDGGTVSGCTVSGSVTGLYSTGGIVGYNDEDGTVSGCTVSGSVTGLYSTGGIVGVSSDGTVSGCTVSGSVRGENFTGGIVGQHLSGIVSGCTVSGSVRGENYIGGIVGYNDHSTVSGCTVSGSVRGENYIGGIVGEHFSGIVMACGNTATVAGSHYVGGIVGYIDSGGTVTGCWTIDTQETESPNNITEDDKDGIGTMNSNATATACYSFTDAAAVTDEAISAMNTAIGTTVTWKWQAGTNGSWPTLTTSD